MSEVRKIENDTDKNSTSKSSIDNTKKSSSEINVEKLPLTTDEARRAFARAKMRNKGLKPKREQSTKRPDISKQAEPKKKLTTEQARRETAKKIIERRKTQDKSKDRDMER